MQGHGSSAIGVRLRISREKLDSSLRPTAIAGMSCCEGVHHADVIDVAHIAAGAVQ